MSHPSLHPELARLPEEPQDKWAALIDFASDGVSRRKNVFARRIGVAQQTVARWAERWKWDERLERYDLAVAGSHNVSVTEKRAEFTKWMVDNLEVFRDKLIALLNDDTVPHKVLLQTIRTCFELAGMLHGADRHDIPADQPLQITIIERVDQ